MQFVDIIVKQGYAAASPVEACLIKELLIRSTQADGTPSSSLAVSSFWNTVLCDFYVVAVEV